jgi:hypothetical protein
MWVEEAIAGQTAQTSTWYERVGVCEGVPANGLLPARAFAFRAPTLPVKRLEGFSLGLELVGVPFDQFSREGGVHLFERHEVTLGVHHAHV